MPKCFTVIPCGVLKQRQHQKKELNIADKGWMMELKCTVPFLFNLFIQSFIKKRDTGKDVH